jgi:hypothetical protein
MLRVLAFSILAVAVTGSSALAQQEEQTRKKLEVKQASAESGQGAAKLASYAQCYPDGGYSGNANSPKPIGYGPMWPATGNRDCSRFYHYPYVFYPQNFYGSEYYRSSDSMYYRYPAEMQIPVYNRQWHNEYPSERRYHWGHHFLLDVF